MSKMSPRKGFNKFLIARAHCTWACVLRLKSTRRQWAGSR